MYKPKLTFGTWWDKNKNTKYSYIPEWVAYEIWCEAQENQNNCRKKITFDEWWQRCYEIDSLYKTLLPYKKHFQNCWYIAQQNS